MYVVISAEIQHAISSDKITICAAKNKAQKHGCLQLKDIVDFTANRIADLRLLRGCE